MSEPATPETGALSVDAAIAALTPAEPVEQEAQAAPEATEEPIEPQGDDQSPEGAEAEPEEPAEGEETEAEAEAVEPVEPPKYWSQDAKAKFAELPPELQAVVLAQEGPREEAAAKAKAEAAETRKAADAEMEKVTKLASELGEFLPQAIETFRNRWGESPDWVAYAEEHGAEAMTVAKARHEQELSNLQRLASATQQAEAQAHEAFVKAEFAKLAEIAPELTDPEKGHERRTAVTKYLVAQGVPAEALSNISATEMLIADKARRWDEAQAALKAAPKPKPAAPPKAPVRPAATGAATPDPSRQIANRFAQTRTVDDAVALLLAKKA